MHACLSSNGSMCVTIVVMLTMCAHIHLRFRILDCYDKFVFW